MKKTLFTLAIATGSLAFGQGEISNFTGTGRAGVSTAFATDYQCLGINPANLGVPDKYEDLKMALGFSETSASMYSEALTKTQLIESFKSVDGNFSYAEKQDAVGYFSDKMLSANVDMMHFGFSFQHPTIGGFAVNIRERANWYSQFSRDAAEILFLGAMAPYFDSYTDAQGNPTMDPSMAATGAKSNPERYSEILDGSTMGLSWTREYNFGYGRNVVNTEVLKVYAGLGVKYIQGLGIMEISAENGELTAHSALTPMFNIDYGTVAASNPSTLTQAAGFLPKTVGSGLGFDLGTTIEIGEKLTVSASVTDIGSMKWTGNVYNIVDSQLDTLSNDGFDSYNLFKEMGTFAGDTTLFEFNGVSDTTTNLPTAIRLGAKFEVSDKLNVGVDMILPGNDAINNVQSAAIMLGGDMKVLPFLTVSTGMTVGGNYGTNIPFGVTFGNDSGKYEAGIASRDITTFLKENKPNLSLSFGFMRMRF